MTQLPNPFLNSTALAPASVESAVASSDLQPRATAAQISTALSSTSSSDAKTDAVKTEGAVSVSTASSDIDCINEIFFYARKLMKQPPRFVLDEVAFMAEVEETPLFLREDGYLQRREA